MCVKLENPSILDYINSAMAANCFYYDNDGNEDSTVTCINANFDDKEILTISVFIVKDLFYIILAANYTLSKFFPFIVETNEISCLLLFLWLLSSYTLNTNNFYS